MWLPNVNETPELFTCGIWFFKQAIKQICQVRPIFLTTSVLQNRVIHSQGTNPSLSVVNFDKERMWKIPQDSGIGVLGGPALPCTILPGFAPSLALFCDLGPVT